MNVWSSGFRKQQFYELQRVHELFELAFEGKLSTKGKVYFLVNNSILKNRFFQKWSYWILQVELGGWEVQKWGGD